MSTDTEEGLTGGHALHHCDAGCHHGMAVALILGAILNQIPGVGVRGLGVKGAGVQVQEKGFSM